MKKILLVLFIAAGMAFSGKVQAQRISFYYYPDLDVYYNTRTHQYAYSDNGNWTYHRSLPRTMRTRGHEHVTVWGQRNVDIWNDHDSHREKYKNWGRRHDHDHDRNRDRDHDHH